jgi:LytS/YehU family sensor histidine kinase
LTTIGYLIEAAPHRAFDTLMRLTVLLRSAFRSEGDFTTLGHELNLVEAYLDIERARFEDRLQVRIDVPAALRQARIPPLLLQPLVENAVKHGVAPKRFGGQVTVRARLEQGGGDAYVLAVVVHDTGSGISDAMLQHGRAHGTGLRNIERRLECLYGQAGCLLFNSSEDNGTTVEIRLPVAAWVEEEAVERGG